MTFFLSIFRQFVPDLYSYFEEEAVDMRELAHAWLDGLFAKEMQIGMLMRLWGTFCRSTLFDHCHEGADIVLLSAAQTSTFPFPTHSTFTLTSVSRS